jgi:NtrC-family two-component system sensor histidine kinase KinB
MQLLLSHLMLVLLMGLVMSTSIANFFSLSRTVDNVSEENIRSILAAQSMHEALERQNDALVLAIIGEQPQARDEFKKAERDHLNALNEATRVAINQPNRTLVREITFRTEDIAVRANYVFEAESNDPNRIAAFLETTDLINEAQSRATRLLRQNEEQIILAKNKAGDLADRAAWLSIFYTAIALVVAVLLAARMMRLALTPLAMLAKHAQVIGSGNLDKQVKLERTDEIGELADSFNEMASKLAELRKSEERKIRRAEKMTDSAFESLYDPVIVTDAKGRIVHLNRAAEKLFGPAPESPRMPVIEHIGDKRIVSAISKAIQHQSASAPEDESAMVPLKVEGGDRTYRLRANPMKDDEGGVLGSVVVLEDVTRLREIDRLKTEFIGVASHELRTPITSLLLSVELMEEGAAGPMTQIQREIVQAQKQDLERLERLTRELLDLTRMETGAIVPKFERIPAKELLTAAYQGVASQAENKGVNLKLEARDDLPPVRADRSQMTRVLVNLLNNAIRHTHSGGSVTLRATESKNNVTFEVADTGEGIPAEYLAKIFDRFVQVPGATQGGAGLGLSIAQRIVYAHGGVMQVGSELGRGSTFSFSLSTLEEDGEEAA